ncbi:MAG: SRPBCC domain-containing protein [Pseudomonadales bacterium]
MSSRVLVALRVDVSRERAFDVFVQDIGAWWRPNGLFRTAPDEPGTLSFDFSGATTLLVETSPDGERYQIGEVVDYRPPERLTFTWRQADFPEGLVTEVAVRFDAVAATTTRVSVEHRGFHAVPEDSAARHGFPDAALQMRLAEWWRTLLDNLADHTRPDPN